MIRPVVVKVGGSLLDWPDLPDRLGAYLAGRGDARLLLIVGGGRAADVVQDLDRVHGLGDEPAHRLALHALDLTARLLAAIVPGLEVVEDVRTLATAWDSGRFPVLAPRRFLEDVDGRSPGPLPPSWDVTTDAIAARVAVHLGARELVLIKSAPLPDGADRESAARLGLVDRAFPAVARPLGCVTYLNLRDPARSTGLALDPGESSTSAGASGGGVPTPATRGPGSDSPASSATPRSSPADLPDRQDLDGA